MLDVFYNKNVTTFDLFNCQVLEKKGRGIMPRLSVYVNCITLEYIVHLLKFSLFGLPSTPLSRNANTGATIHLTGRGLSLRFRLEFRGSWGQFHGYLCQFWDNLWDKMHITMILTIKSNNLRWYMKLFDWNSYM